MARSFGIGFAIGARLAPSVAGAFATVEQKVRASSQRMSALTRQSQVLASAGAAKAQLQETQRLYAASGGKDPLMREVLRRNIATYNKAREAAKKYGLAVNDYGRAHKMALAEIAREEARLKALTAVRAASEKRSELRGRMMEAVVPVMTLAAPVASAIKFESAMADAAKTIDGMRDSSGKLTPKYYEMEAAIKQMGRTLPLTHEELAKLFAAGGQQGMGSVKDLQEFTTMSAHMAVAFGMSTEEAADAIGGYRTAMHLSFKDTRDMLDLMNQFANTTSASEKGIADIVRRIGPLGRVGGVAAKPMTALAATLDAMKVAPEVAATGIKNLILNMTAGAAATKQQKAAFAQLGIDTVKLAKQMQTDGPAAIISVLEAVKKLPKAQQLSLMQQIFGKESLGAIAPLLDSLDQVKKNLIISGDSAAYAGAMQAEFENRSRTTANALILAKNRVSELGVNVGSVLLPPIVGLLELLGPLVSGVAEFAQHNQGLTTVVVGTAAALMLLHVGGLAAAYAGASIAGGWARARLIVNFFRLSTLRANASLALHRGALIATKTGTLAFAAASKIAAFGVKLISLAFSASPLGWVVRILMLISAGLVYLYNNCEPVRRVFDAVFSFIGGKIAWVWDKLTAVGNWLRSIGEKVGLVDEKVEEKKEARRDAVEAEAAAASADTGPVPQAFDPGAVPAAPAGGMSSLPAGMPGLNGMSGGGGVAVSASFSFNINGVPDAEFGKRVIAALGGRKSDFERLVSEIVHDQMRVAYGS